MNQTQPPVPPGVAQLCFRYQSAVDSGNRPLIEDLLRELPAELRSTGLLALLAIELAWRQKRGEPFDEEEYCQRFPSQASSIREWLYATQVSTRPRPGPTAGAIAPPGYEILEELGRGGMGVVFKARDQRLKRLVALKMILSADLADSAELTRFQREAEVTARLAHAGIVQVHQVGTHEGRPYLVMELVAGGSLASKLRGKPVPARQVATIASQLARAVEVAHEAGIIHRDLKPGNILVGPNWQLKIGDFGLARRLDEQGQTRTGAVLGTPAYMAPEQARGEKDVGPAADIYSLGAILYELLTGKPPFRGAMMDILDAVMNREPVRPSVLNPKLAPDLEIICLKCLEKEPYRRYASAGALADDLERFLRHEPIQARPAGVVERLAKSIRRRPARAALIGLSMLTLMLVTVGLYFASSARGFRDSADAEKEQRLQVEAKQQVEEEQRHRDNEAIVQRKHKQERHTLYLRTLLRAEVLWPAAPAQVLALLDDPAACPVNLREANHLRLLTLARRSVKTIPTPASYQTSSPGDFMGQAFAFSPDGKVMAQTSKIPVPRDSNSIVVDTDVLLELVDLDSGRLLHSLGKVALATASEGLLAFSPDGRLLAAALSPRTYGLGSQGSLRLWNVSTGKAGTGFDLPSGTARRLVFRPDGRTLAVQTQDQVTPENFDRGNVSRAHVPLTRITLFDVPGGREVKTFGPERMQVSALAFSANGKDLLTAGGREDKSGSLSGWIALWDVEANKKRFDHFEEKHPNGLLTAALSPDGKTIAFPAAQEGIGFQATPPQITLWNVDNRKKQGTLSWGEDNGPFKGISTVGMVSRMEFSPDGKYLFLCGASGEVKLLEVDSGKARLSYSQGGPIAALAFTRDGEELITGATRRMSAFVGPQLSSPVQRWRIRSGKARTALRPTLQVRSVALSPDGKTLAVGTEEWADAKVTGRIFLSDLGTGKQLAVMAAHAGPVRALAFSPDGQTLASGGLGKPLGGGEGLGGLLAARTLGEVKLWPMPEGPPESINLLAQGARQSRPGDVTALRFEPGGKRLAIAMGGLVFLHDCSAKAEINPLGEKGQVLINPPIATALGEQQIVYSIAFSPDGRFLAAGGLRRDQSLAHAGQPQVIEGTIRILDVRRATELITYQGHSGAVHWLAFAADGRSLVSAALPEKMGQPVESREWDTSKVFDQVRREDPRRTLAR